MNRRQVLVVSMALAVASAASASPRDAAPNVVTLTMHAPRAGFNRLTVSITVCAPGTKRCATIGDVMIDTGSTGLRLESFAVPPGLALPAALGPDGHALGECVRFVHDAAWGDVARADVHLGGLIAADLPIQIIGAGHAAAACPPTGAQPTSNGTLGIGTHLTDCAGTCTQNRESPIYFTCTAGTCTAIEGTVAPRYRLPNPVARLTPHDNGIVLDLPAPTADGTGPVVGTLTFGVGTAANNQPGSAHLLRLDASGVFTTRYATRAYPHSYIDSGTETYLLPDVALPRCHGMDWAFCVAPPRRLEATMVGADGMTVTVPFQVGDYADISKRHVEASDSLAEAAPPPTGAFVWGAPFFLGKRVVLVMDNKPVPGAAGIVGPLYGVP